MVVRHLVPSGQATDVLGELVAQSATSVTVQPDAGGPPKVIARTEIVAMKQIPPRPVRARDIRAIQNAAARSWPGATHEWIDGWFVRASAGITRRGNCAAPLAPDASMTSHTSAAIANWLRSQNVSPLYLLIDRLPQPPITFHDDAPLPEVCAFVGVTESIAGACPPLPAGLAIEVSETPTDRWLGGHPERRVVESAVQGQVRFFTVTNADAVVATARLTVTEDAPPAGQRDPDAIADPGQLWAGVHSLHVAPQFRRRGIAAALLGAVCQAGADAGAERVFLQVVPGNDGAIALYRQLGFVEHHRYRYGLPR